MNLIDNILKINYGFTKKRDINSSKIYKYPYKKIAIITCMDTRLINFLEPALGINRGDAIIIKIAGNIISNNFNDIIRSLLICIYQFNIKDIIIIGHYDCGMHSISSTSLINKMLDNNINIEKIKLIKEDLISWINKFSNPKDNVIQSVNNIINNSIIPENIFVHGMLIDPNSRKIDILINGYE